MELGDSGELVRRLNALGELFDVTLSPARKALYFEALRDLPFEAVAAALSQAAKTCRFMPRPAEIRELACGGAEDRAEAAWMALRAAMSAAGAYRSLLCDATLGEAVVAVFGSWPAACSQDLSPEMWSSKRKEFGRVYRVLANRALDGSRYLPGICEQQNAGRPEWSRFNEVYALDGDHGRYLTAVEAEQQRTLSAAHAHGFSSLRALLPAALDRLEADAREDAS